MLSLLSSPFLHLLSYPISLPVTPPAISTVYGAIAMSMPGNTKSLNGDTYQRVDEFDPDDGKKRGTKQAYHFCILISTIEITNLTGAFNSP